MKNILFFLPLVLSVSMLNGQIAFRHVTNASNTNGHITTLNHSQLNGNPNAIVFIMPNYNTNGADPVGADYQQNAGVWYNGSRWTIFNQNTKAPMPLNLTFNVLIAPSGNANYFTISCTAATKAGLAPNSMVIDHPATNNKPDALLLVTQNWAGTYNDNSPIVSYSNGKWYISNNKYLLTPEISAKTTLPPGARFNVMVIENNAVSGFPNARAFMHTTTAENIIPSGNAITFFDQPFLNDNTNAIIWATPNWGWSPGRNAGQTSGPYNDSPINSWYDHPTDPWNYKNGYWSIYNSDGTILKPGTKFNIVAINVGDIPPQPTRDLTGFYRGDNGSCGQTYIRQIGNNVYWFGEHPDGSFGHVFSGTISGNTLTGNLWDVPKGTLMNKGTCVYSIAADGNTLALTGGTIGCNVLVKTTMPAALPASKPMQAGSGALTGVWDCNDGAATYVREDGSDFIFFSEAKNNGTRPGFANLYIGKRNGNTITGNWIDVPKGTHLGSGAMTLQVESGTRFVRVGEANGYGGGVWTRGADVDDPRYWNFETGHINGWIKDGNAFDGQPNSGDAQLRLPDTWRKTVSLGGNYWRDIIGLFPYHNGYQGQYWVTTANTNVDNPHSVVDIPGDYATGTMFSKEFNVNTNYISYLVSGFSAAKLCRVGLLVLDDGTIQKTYSYQGWETRMVGNRPQRFPVTRNVALPIYSIEGRNYVAYYFGVRSITDILSGANVNINDLLSKDVLESDLFTRQHFQIPSSLRGKKARIAIIDMDEKGHINVDDIRFENTLSPPIQVPQPALPLWGFVDMHTHPVAQYGFGGELFWGQNDGNPAQALGSCNCVHNFIVPPFDGNCSQQNMFRNTVVDETDTANEIAVHAKVAGFPNFDHWPRNSSVLHQQMYVDWIRRAYQGGLRIMIALTVNNHCLADVAETAGPNDDLRSMNIQIEKIKEFVSRHDEPSEDGFMEIAYTPADLRRIISQNKLAIIIGLEMDNIGNFYNPADPKGGSYNPNPSNQDVQNEIDRLHGLGVRYIFPVHVTNNVFGGAAIYDKSFNVANKYNTGLPFRVETVGTDTTGIAFKLTNPYKDISTPEELQVAAFFSPGTRVLNTALQYMIDELIPSHVMPNRRSNYPEYPDPGAGRGHRNELGLTDKGIFAITYMMQKGMMIDVDHMSDIAIKELIRIAEENNYPVNSGHSGPRGREGNERLLLDYQYNRMATLGGMAGIGTGDAATLVRAFRQVSHRMKNRQMAFGTDANGLYKLPDPPAASGRINYRTSATGNLLMPYRMAFSPKTWDYNTEGMSHYGMFPDYLESISRAGLRKNDMGTVFLGAEYFAQMWEKCERQKTQVR